MQEVFLLNLGGNVSQIGQQSADIYWFNAIVQAAPAQLVNGLLTNQF
jgi:hypothetical protein